MRLIRFGLIILAASSLLLGSPMVVAQTQDTKIAKIEGELLTVQTGKKFRTYRCTKVTEIVLNGQPAGWTDLRKGMFVTVTMGTDPKDASRVVAEGQP